MHPTPAEIRYAITNKLADDSEQNPMDGPVPFIPVRVMRLVNEAITEACDRKDNQR